MLSLYIFFAIASLFISPAFALALGIATTLAIGNPFSSVTKQASKILLQVCVVAMGFGVNLYDSLQTGVSGVIFTAISISSILLLGLLLGRWLSLDRKCSYLISVGTAICGGSAIAAVAPIVKSDEDTTSISLAAIFTLNALALFIFPYVGHMLELSQEQFGLWAAFAIHDTSSVVGAASIYGEEARSIATLVKLTRALWIIPISLITPLLFKGGGGKIQIPYFILAFVGVALLNTFVELPEVPLYWIDRGATSLLSTTLFLIGTGLSVESIKRVGARPLVLAVVLWALISVGSLLVIMW